MAIKTSAGQVVLTVSNANRETATPPIKFQDLNSNTDFPGPYSNFSYAIQVRLTSNIPSSVLQLNGTDGSYLQLGHDGVNWSVRVRSLGINFGSNVQIPVKLNTWVQFVVTVNIAFIEIFYGEETTSATNIKIASRGGQNYPLVFPFANFQVIVPVNGSINNFKYWNSILTPNQFEDQVSRWDAIGPGAAPMWSSTLRTPGDISNIANPYTSLHWEHGHGYDSIDHPENLLFDSIEPVYLADNHPCPTWVYQVNPPSNVTVTPGTTPAVTTIFKGTQFWQFADKGSVPITIPFTNITYYGLPFHTQGGVNPSSTFPLYRDEHGIEVSDTVNRFDVNTGVPLPAAVFSSNMYDWVYSAQFQYDPPGGLPAAVGNLIYQYLYVKYVGRPTGVGIPHVPGVPPEPPKPPDPEEPPVPPIEPGEPPIPPPQPTPVAMSGLFAIAKGTSIDNYDPTIQLKIPDPTIRTALIGE